MEITNLLELLMASSLAIIIIIIVLLFAILLKGFALYRAARKESKGWFWVILIFNTFGILPLLYLIFSKKEVN